MRAKRRCMHGKRLRRSAIKKEYDFSNKKTFTGEGTIGEKFAEAITPENTVKGVVSSVVPIGRLGKIAKTMYNIFTA